MFTKNGTHLQKGRSCGYDDHWFGFRGGGGGFDGGGDGDDEENKNG